MSSCKSIFTAVCFSKYHFWSFHWPFGRTVWFRYQLLYSKIL